MSESDIREKVSELVPGNATDRIAHARPSCILFFLFYFGVLDEGTRDFERSRARRIVPFLSSDCRMKFPMHVIFSTADLLNRYAQPFPDRQQSSDMVNGQSEHVCYSGSTTPSYSASVQAQALEMERPAPSSRDRKLGQETTPTPTTPTSVQHQLGQARPNGERRRQQEPQWDAPDDDEGLWTLVSEKKPAEKKAVLYLGKLKPGVKESEIIDYVNRRSEKPGALPPTIHNCKIFEKEVEEGEIIEFCGARLTIDNARQSSSATASSG